VGHADRRGADAQLGPARGAHRFARGGLTGLGQRRRRLAAAAVEHLARRGAHGVKRAGPSITQRTQGIGVLLEGELSVRLDHEHPTDPVRERQDPLVERRGQIAVHGPVDRHPRRQQGHGGDR